MGSAHQLIRRSLQTRLTLFYAAGVFLVGILVLGVVAVPLAGVQSTNTVGADSAGTVTSSGNGVGPGQILTYSMIALALLVPVALLVGWFVAGRFLQPLRSITATAKDISAGSLDRRLNLGEPADELSELGRTLDNLFARLEASFDAQRHFVANASHELRTPLAGQRTLLEVALADPEADAETLRSVCQEALGLGEHQERLVQALLTLATSESVTRWDAVDLAHVTRDVLDSRRGVATARSVRLVERLAPGPTAGDTRLVETLVANLVDNAVRYNHPDGFVEITTETAGSRAILTVTNSGPVIPDDRVQRLLQPFQRLSSDRNGHPDGYGLGLAIVNAVAQAHHATLTAGARPEGGLRISVAFERRQEDRRPDAWHTPRQTSLDRRGP